MAEQWASVHVRTGISPDDFMALNLVWRNALIERLNAKG